MNKTISAGNLVDDPQISYTQDGKAIARFTLALNGYKDQVDYPRFVAWEKKAEILEKWCHKGDKLIIEGRIKTGSYENKEGKKVYTTEIYVESLEFAGRKQAEQLAEQQPEENPSDEWMKMPDGIDEELPFN